MAHSTRSKTAAANEERAAAIHEHELELKSRITREALNRIEAEKQEEIQRQQYKEEFLKKKEAELDRQAHDDEHGPCDPPTDSCIILGGTKRKRKSKITRKHKKRSYKHRRSRSYKRKH